MECKDSRSYFRSLLRPYCYLEENCPFSDYSSYVILSEKQKKELFSSFVQTATYPMLLYGLMILIALFFTQSVLPRLRSGFLARYLEESVFTRYGLFLQSFTLFSLVLILVFLTLFLLFLLKRSRSTLFRIFFLFRPKNLFSLFYSLNTASLLRCLYGSMEAGCKMFSLLQKTPSILSLFSADLLLQAYEREDWTENLHLEPFLVKCLHSGQKSGNTKEILSDYVSIIWELLLFRTRQLLQSFTYLVYLLCAILIVVLYRLLMLPLKSMRFV